jgi:hypothetical protein
MRILFLNHAGGGFADYIEVTEGTTLGQLFSQRLPGARPGDYLVRLNRQPAAADEVLTEGSRVSITPTKIEGARRYRTHHAIRRAGPHL